MESSELVSFWSKPGEEGGEENKQSNNLFQLERNYLSKEKSGMNENCTHTRIRSFRTSETSSEKRSRNATNPRESSFNRHCSQHKLSQKRDTHTSEEELQVLNRRRPKNEVSKKIPSLSSRYNPALYQVQVLKTRGRL